MSYLSTLNYLDSFINYEKKAAYPYKRSFKLQRMKGFLRSIGNPQESLRCVHVAGTKGKGSVCVFVASILREQGFSVGLYTSPHLSDVRERIRILLPDSRRHYVFEGMISRCELDRLVERLKPYIDVYSRTSRYGPLSFFEVYTALALAHFQENKVDFAVLEAGLGGRLDATNVVDPLVCGITSISYDHMNKLGNTLSQIAREKSGIIKGGIVVSAAQDPQALMAIKKRCLAKHAKLYVVGKDICYQQRFSGQQTQKFDLSGVFGCIKGLKIRFLGQHQLDNAAQAVALALNAAHASGLILKQAVIKMGLGNALWPVRCEVVRRRPLIILDGAHNIASAAALCKTFQENFPGKKAILVLGISKDKDACGICTQLLPICQQVIITKAANPRAFNPAQIAGCINWGIPVQLTQDVYQALACARETAQVNDAIIIAGSLFVAAEAREILLSHG